MQSVDVEHGTVTVETAEASRRAVELQAVDAPLELHYATHVYKAQGTTVDRTYVITGGWQTSKESLYVACSRSREGTRLYLDHESLRHDVDADAIAEAARRGAASRAKVAATTVEAGARGRHNAEQAAAAPRRTEQHRPMHKRKCRPDPRPLTDRWHHRKERQEALRSAACHRASHRLAEQRRHEPAVPTLDTIAALQDVPVWALQTAQQVTGRSYVAEHVAR